MGELYPVRRLSKRSWFLGKISPFPHKEKELGPLRTWGNGFFPGLPPALSERILQGSNVELWFSEEVGDLSICLYR
ncbi:hypothetical protein E3J84_07360 [Candidatus Aerophobetes bacterium]|uniref:Uncharacterized protein n=1 Tax=Aerophobetes bacterium TaxID=2030807 RepID=A0A523RP50_UNCAE|nr:MAG: hypothetical protein E3J84_07360 [Candidatus Aerophobetes bacterium]